MPYPPACTMVSNLRRHWILLNRLISEGIFWLARSMFMDMKHKLGQLFPLAQHWIKLTS